MYTLVSDVPRQLHPPSSPHPCPTEQSRRPSVSSPPVTPTPVTYRAIDPGSAAESRPVVTESHSISNVDHPQSHLPHAILSSSSINHVPGSTLSLDPDKVFNTGHKECLPSEKPQMYGSRQGRMEGRGRYPPVRRKNHMNTLDSNGPRQLHTPSPPRPCPTKQSQRPSVSSPPVNPMFVPYRAIDPGSATRSKPVVTESHPISDVDHPHSHLPHVILSSSSINHVPGRSQPSLESDKVFHTDRKIQHLEVVFKILCPKENVVSVIGKGGTIIMSIANETGTEIIVGPVLADCDERLITVAAMESIDAQYSPAQKAAVLVFYSFVVAGIMKKLDSNSKGPTVSVRVVVPSNQVGCLLGEGGAVIEEMRKESGAALRLIRVNQVPTCASENDEVIQITGEFVNVRDALYKVTGRLRDSMFDINMTSGCGNHTFWRTDNSAYSRVRDPPAFGSHLSQGMPENPNEFESLTKSVDHLTISNNIDRPPSPNLVPSSMGAGAHEDSTLHNSGRLPSVKGAVEVARYVWGALYKVTGRLRVRDPPPCESHLSLGMPENPNEFKSLTKSDDHITISNNIDRPPSPNLVPSLMGARTHEDSTLQNSGGLPSVKGAVEVGSGSRSVIVTNTTIQIVVSDTEIGSIYGENGRNLALLREISGAKVTVHDETTRRTLIISGTPDETLAAQSLLQAFILT